MDDGQEFRWYRIVRPVAGDAGRRAPWGPRIAHPGAFEWPCRAGFAHRPAHLQCPGADCNSSVAMSLERGDVIINGTPGGVGAAHKPPVFMKAGDIFEVEIEKVGVLTNSVQDD